MGHLSLPRRPGIMQARHRSVQDCRICQCDRLHHPCQCPHHQTNLSGCGWKQLPVLQIRCFLQLRHQLVIGCALGGHVWCFLELEELLGNNLGRIRIYQNCQRKHLWGLPSCLLSHCLINHPPLKFNQLKNNLKNIMIILRKCDCSLPEYRSIVILIFVSILQLSTTFSMGFCVLFLFFLLLLIYSPLHGHLCYIVRSLFLNRCKELDFFECSIRFPLSCSHKMTNWCLWGNLFTWPALQIPFACVLTLVFQSPCPCFSRKPIWGSESALWSVA